MSNLFVARISNNSLGACTPVASVDKGIQLISKLLGRELTEDEKEQLEDDLQLIFEDENKGFCIGMLDEE
jgi:hypothetical protein